MKEKERLGVSLITLQMDNWHLNRETRFPKFFRLYICSWCIYVASQREFRFWNRSLSADSSFLVVDIWGFFFPVFFFFPLYKNLYLKKACVNMTENTSEFYETVCVFIKAKLMGVPWQCRLSCDPRYFICPPVSSLMKNNFSRYLSKNAWNFKAWEVNK